MPGNDWTDDHFNQGFTRRDSSVSFRTLLQFGYARVQVFNNDYVLDNDDERVIKVPFYCPSGKVFVEGPERIWQTRLSLNRVIINLLPLNKANYDDETLFIRLYFLKIEIPDTKSEIIIKDEQLNPPRQFLETAEIASF